LSCGGGTPTSDNFQKSKEKNWENLNFFEAMQWTTLKFMSEVHLWLSFGYQFELAVSDENYPFYAPLKFSSSLRRANIATFKNPFGYCLKGTPHSPANLKKKFQILTPFLACCHLRPFEITPFEGQNMHENSGHTRLITLRDRCNSLTPLHYLREGALR